jgi:hypothetical protein
MLWSQDHNNGEQVEEFKRKKGRKNPSEKKKTQKLREVLENQLHDAVYWVIKRRTTRLQGIRRGIPMSRR